MSEPIQAFPLQWPPGWRRQTLRTRAKFHGSTRQYGDDGRSSWLKKRELSIPEALARVMGELGRMGVSRDDVVISSNLPLRLDGMPRGDARNPGDPGVAVYWRKGKVQRCMAVDRYDRVQDNLSAIAATLEAMRAIERHGGAEILDRAFTGFIALPAPEQPWQVLGLETSTPTRDQVEDAHRRLAMQHHPDRGGDAHTMARINAARDDLLERLS